MVVSIFLYSFLRSKRSEAWEKDCLKIKLSIDIILNERESQLILWLQWNMSLRITSKMDHKHVKTYSRSVVIWFLSTYMSKKWEIDLFQEAPKLTDVPICTKEYHVWMWRTIKEEYISATISQGLKLSLDELPNYGIHHSNNSVI